MSSKSPSLPAAIIRRNFLLHSLSLIAALAYSPFVFAQHPEINTLAAQAGKDLAKKKIKVVSVSFFSFENGGISETGRLLSLEFSAALAKVEPEIQIIDSGRLKVLAEERHLLPYDVFHPEVARRLSGSLGAKLQIRGTLKTLGDSLKLDLEWVDALSSLRSDGQHLSPKRVGKASAILALTPDLTSLLSRANSEDSSGFLVAGAPGSTYPQCSYCPVPQFNDEARRTKTAGPVLLLVTVTAEGSVVNPLVLSRLGAGLDDAALEAIQKWRFIPAKDANGRAAVMRLEVEVVFRLLW